MSVAGLGSQGSSAEPRAPAFTCCCLLPAGPHRDPGSPGSGLRLTRVHLCVFGSWAKSAASETGFRHAHYRKLGENRVLIKETKVSCDCLTAQGEPLSVSWGILSSLFMIHTRTRTHTNICCIYVFLHNWVHTLLKPNIPA